VNEKKKFPTGENAGNNRSRLLGTEEKKKIDFNKGGKGKRTACARKGRITGEKKNRARNAKKRTPRASNPNLLDEQRKETGVKNNGNNIGTGTTPRFKGGGEFSPKKTGGSLPWEKRGIRRDLRGRGDGKERGGLFLGLPKGKRQFGDCPPRKGVFPLSGKSL